MPKVSRIASIRRFLVFGVAMLGPSLSAQPKPIIAVRFEFHDGASRDAEHRAGTAGTLSVQLSTLLNDTFAKSSSILRYWSFKDKARPGDPILVISPEVNGKDGRFVKVALSDPTRNVDESAAQCKAPMVFPGGMTPTGASAWYPVLSKALTEYIDHNTSELLAVLRWAPVSLSVTPLLAPSPYARAKIGLPADDDGRLLNLKFRLVFADVNGPVDMPLCGTGVKTSLGATLRVLVASTVASRYLRGPTTTAAFLTTEHLTCNPLMGVTSQVGTP